VHLRRRRPLALSEVEEQAFAERGPTDPRSTDAGDVEHRRQNDGAMDDLVSPVGVHAWNLATGCQWQNCQPADEIVEGFSPKTVRALARRWNEPERSGYGAQGARRSRAKHDLSEAPAPEGVQQ
jgi:hypothetical protein